MSCIARAVICYSLTAACIAHVAIRLSALVAVNRHARSASCAVAIRRKKPAIFAWAAMMAGLKGIGVSLLHGNEPEGYAVVAILEAILGLGFSRA